ncbi:flagellar basal body-associated FliL family protein [Gallaecimonas kandeliae]|uniref:flagellar basal body-associated FliL family protein n=1 Tax=Gallaecimonas kandeliae TaxID=3029055 RepID=UPI0026489B17|nr:flagellar basal body-associated FliL family protein [Gallaecimonas kandeliae]WKE66545.1 flagellar basal body-associated FliL family protein [Gallaecimonas kandeliae]
MSEKTKEKSPRRKRWSWLLVLAVLLVAGSAFGYGWVSGLINPKAWFADPPPPPLVMSEKPLFQPLDKFVISLAGDEVQHYMMLELALVSHDPRMPEQSKELQPVIRNALLQYFSTRKYQEVREEIKDLSKLQLALKDRLKQTVDSYGYQLAVDEVLLTKVVIQ